MGTSGVKPPTPQYKDPLLLNCRITKRPLGYSDVRYLTRDPVLENFYISNSLERETILLPLNCSEEYKINNCWSKPRDPIGPYNDRPTLSTHCLPYQPVMLVTYQSFIAVCSMDGDLINRFHSKQINTRLYEKQLLGVCADSLDAIYVLSQVNYHGSVRGEITELSCQFTEREMFSFGVDRIKTARDMCKQRNKLYVLHESERCILVFSVDGLLLSALVSGLARDLPHAIYIPMHMTVTSEGNMITSNWGDNTISFIDKKGNVIAFIQSSAETPFSKPSGLYFDKSKCTLYCVTQGLNPQFLSIKLPPYMEAF